MTREAQITPPDPQHLLPLSFVSGSLRRLLPFCGGDIAKGTLPPLLFDSFVSASSLLFSVLCGFDVDPWCAETETGLFNTRPPQSFANWR